MAKKTTDKTLNVPNLRFPGFEGEWEQFRLGDISEIKTGDKDTQNKVENGLYPFFVRSNTVERINSFSYDGEAILTSGDGVGVGKNFHYINGKFDFHQRVYSLRKFKDGYCGKYIYFLFSEKFYNRVVKLSAKNSVDSVRMDMIAGMVLYNPSYEEQKKISSIISVIDIRIQTQSKIIEELKTLKTNILKKMFSQSIRFKEFSSDWELKELGEIAERVITKNKENNQNVLTISAQLGLISQLDFFNKLVAAKNVSGYYLLKKDDFAYNKSYSNGYPMGAIKRLKNYDKGVVSTLYICFRFRNDINYSFMEQYFESGIQNTELEKITQEGARNHGLLNIGISDFFGIKLLCPIVKEQTKIANFLSAFDNKIELESALLKQYEEQKKYLLQNLFI